MLTVALGRCAMQVHSYRSADSAHDTDKPQSYPEEFLHTLAPSGLPPHKLDLKEEMPIMLLRNLNPTQGLANGTRLILKKCRRHHLECEHIGTRAGQRVFIPRVNMQPSDTDLPFELRRRQFPIRPSFARTINKAQGQTLDVVGVYLPTSAT